jgi:RNA polymerase sigma-70 factor (ECF subfamily)
MERVVTDSRETENLLERVRAGDSGALDELFARHRASIRQMVELRLDPKLRRRVDPSDVVQEAQIEAARRMAAYLDRPPMAFRLWLRRIAYDRLLMMRRRHLEAGRRAVTCELPLPDGSTVHLGRQLMADVSTPSQHLIRAELGRRVRQAIAQLAETDREVLLMRNFEGLSNQEAAHVLGIDPSAANKRYGRALFRLRALLLRTGLTESVYAAKPSQRGHVG